MTKGTMLSLLTMNDDTYNSVMLEMIDNTKNIIDKQFIDNDPVIIKHRYGMPYEKHGLIPGQRLATKECFWYRGDRFSTSRGIHRKWFNL